MTTRREILFTATRSAAALAAISLTGRASAAETFEVNLTDAQWRAKLTPQQYTVLRREATEYPGSSPLNKENRAGTYACAGCALPLFESPRVSRRLNTLRGLSHEQVEQVLARGA